MKHLLAPAFALLVLAGCQGRLGGSGAVGYFKPIQVGWESEKEPKIVEGTDLEIRSNGTFLIRGFPKIEGRVDVEGDLVLLRIEKADDKPVKNQKSRGGATLDQLPPVRLRLVDGGSRLRPDTSNENPLKFTWVRSER